MFLADGNSLVLDTEQLVTILDALASAFPRLRRIGIYASARDILGKTNADLATLRQRNMHIVYLGLESGSDEVLRRVNKGITAGEMVEAVRKLKRAGIRASIIALLGLGGTDLSVEHAEETGRVVGVIYPEYLSMLSVDARPRHRVASGLAGGLFSRLPEPAGLPPGTSTGRCEISMVSLVASSGPTMPRTTCLWRGRCRATNLASSPQSTRRCAEGVAHFARRRGEHCSSP